MPSHSKAKSDTKKKSLHATQAETERVQILRQEYRQIVQNIHPEDLISIDETGVNLAMIRMYARAYKGQRAYGGRPEQRGENITVVGVIASSGFVGAMTVNGSTNGDVLRAFVTQILVPNLCDGACVVMDNLSAHACWENSWNDWSKRVLV